MKRRWSLFLGVGLLSIIADQLTKLWARTLPTDSHGYGIPQPFIDNFWDWRLSYNKGSAFGLFHGIGGARVILTVVGIAAVIAVVFMVKNARKDQTRLVVGLALVAGGAIGNLIDRISFGEVTDFVVWRYHETEWPTFNVADVVLVIGVGLMLLDMASEAKAERSKKGEDAGGAKTGAKKGASSAKKKR